LYGVCFVKRVPQGGHPFFILGFFVRFEARFFAPTRSFLWPSRAGAVKDGASSRRRRLVLDWPEHDGTLDAVGMTI